ncbi:MAG TPA: DUF1491 family protein [Hyphomicrobiaceae bacterium]|jgi:hypothetical protein
MRLKAEIWAKAYLRSCAAAGVAAAVVRHGDDDAGAIFIKVNRLDGTARLFGPAPAGFDTGQFERQWIAHLDGPEATEAEVDAYLARQVAFDGDLWILELEDRQGRHFLDPWLASSGADDN